MRLLLISALAVAALTLAGCKPPKFDKIIVCPAFEARGVAVYDYQNSYVVVWPDRTHVVVDHTECVIAQAAEIAPPAVGTPSLPPTAVN